MEEFAESLGLPGAPKIKFLNKEMAKKKKNTDRAAIKATSEALEEEAGDETDDGEAHSSSEEEEDVAPSKVCCESYLISFVDNSM